jgi:hypothetical protein
MNAPTAELEAAPKVDQYDFWRRRLKGEVIVIHDGEPQAGFYRNGADPVAYYWLAPDNVACLPSTVRCKIADKRVDHQTAMERWPWASKRPVSHEAYKEKIATGNWPSESKVVSDDIGRERVDPNANTLSGLQGRIDTLKAAADELMKAGAAKEEETSDAAADIANRLAYLWNKADQAREIEKRPHLEACRNVDDKWRPLLSAATIYKTVKAVVVEPYLKVVKAAKDKALADARAEAERLSLAAVAAQEELDAKALTSNAPNELAAAAVQEKVQAAAQAAAKVETVAAQPVTAGTRGGRSIGLRGKTVVTITDREACLVFFKDRPEITALLQTMAEAAVKAGFTVPGVTSTKSSSAA